MFSYAGITQVRFKGFVLSPRRPFKIERAPLTTYTTSYITTSTQKSQEKDGSLRLGRAYYSNNAPSPNNRSKSGMKLGGKMRGVKPNSFEISRTPTD